MRSQNSSNKNSGRRNTFSGQKSRSSFSKGRTYGGRNSRSENSNEKSEFPRKREQHGNTELKKRDDYKKGKSIGPKEDTRKSNYAKPGRDKNDGFKKGNYGKRQESFRKKGNYKKDKDIEESSKIVLPVKPVEKEVEKDYSDQVEGRNSILELLESEKDINKLFVLKGEKHGSINKILGIAKARKIVTIEVERKTLDTMAQSENHQGVIAIVPPFNYCEVEDILNYAKQKNEKPFIMILDGIEDPHNLGSIIRTAETAGVHGVIIPKRRACGVNATVYKVSAGAVEHMNIARVNNITETIKYLKQNDIWICGTDMEAEKYYYNQDLTDSLAIVVGSEGFGMSKLVKENCDFLVKIPMSGKITSLNASVSAAIVIYEAVKQRK